MFFPIKRSIACLVLAIATTGCGGSNAPGTPVGATGTVTLDGKPLVAATVGFTAITEGIPAKYRYTSAITEPDGSFVVDQIYPAEYMVTLNQDGASPGLAAATGPAADQAVVSAVAGNSKLDQYANNSPLRAKVSGEDAKFQFDVLSGQ